MDKRFMLIAIEEAKKSKEELKCGVVITKKDKIITRTFNSQRLSNDATAHAEIKAIKEAGNILQNKDLSDCTIFCTCEPCIMCFSAIILAKIKRVVIGVKLKNIWPDGKFSEINIKDIFKSPKYDIEIVEDFMGQECLEELYQ